MKEQIIKLIEEPIRPLNLFVSDIYETKEEGLKTLNIELDSNNIIDVETITEATKLINPILDATELLKEIDVLDIHSKSKGEEENER